MKTRTQLWLVVAGLVCSALSLWVIGPFIDTLSDMAQVVLGAVVFVAIIWAIGWGGKT